jgi:PleD family two-component response regulator
MINITLSIGICFTEKNESTKEILRDVDHALYESKRNGKNQINIFKENKLF